MFVVSILVRICKGLAALICCGGLFFAGQLLLQGVAQLEGEGLAKDPETAESLGTRLHISLVLLFAGFCGALLYQVTSLFSKGWNGITRAGACKAIFEGSVFLACVCLFICVLIFAGSFQAHWPVPREYYWVAGGLGITSIVLLGAAGLIAEGKAGKQTEPTEI